ncbi:MAG: FecR domain-containing protein [Deltaproteobacteria bacterium]|nr:FecR domain-containing protein [Deltaproteobacteria bacterium]MBW1875367.1 FecR domain-containing protein [Deltaproteobacteria bacterium]MBW2159092.1 FecR domain-containing protein [Deltaproteobacteria bacterium]MBW2213912.1 FecR domain-containing protein [Deltaproteobacteria bacterium]MBW2379356.1 FecR domain-containing protein [Deltaproteobacteria bacterium]
MDERLEQLGAEVARIQDEALPDGRRRAAVRNKLLQASRPSTPRAWRFRRPAIGFALTSVALVAIFLLRPLESEVTQYRAGDAPPSTRVDQWIAAPDTRTLPIVFSDGSTVQLSPGSRARVRQLSATGATVQLEHGEATVHVVHRDETRWSVEAGPFVVNVIGTRFRVQWEPSEEAFGLEVLAGTVRLSGPRGTRRVTRHDGEVRTNLRPPAPVMKEPTIEPAPTPAIETPESRRAAPRHRGPTRAQQPFTEPKTPSYRPPSGRLELKLPPKTPDIAPDTTPPTAAPVVAETEPEPPASEEPAPVTEPAWKALADEGAYEQVLSALSPEQFKEAIWQGDESDLVNLAAAARRTGDARARYIYSVVRSRFSGTDGAANAAFMIARMEFHANAPHAAATWLEIYLRERPHGRFAREATGRLIEAYVHADDSLSAKAAAERYLARYPNGPHAALARSVLQ